MSHSAAVEMRRLFEWEIFLSCYIIWPIGCETLKDGIRKGIEGRGWSYSVPTFTQVAEAFHDLCRDVNQVLLTNPLLLQMTLKQKCQKE